MNVAGNLGVGDASQLGKMDEKTFHDSMVHPTHAATYGDGKPTSLPEYLYWAEKQRAIEDADKTQVHSKGLGQLFAKFNKKQVDSAESSVDEKAERTIDEQTVGLTQRQVDLVNARRALRLAGWGAAFYLVTCDILGPFSAPYAISQVGWVPGVTLYTLFGAAAALTGCMISRLFNRLDSARFPLRTYGDLALCIFGPGARHFCSILQFIQLILNCGLICLSNGQGLSQIAKGNLCFSVCIVIWAVVGIILGQIRGLGNFSVFANSSVWLNILILILSMAFVANSPPNYASAISTYGAAIASGPVSTSAIVPLPVFSQVTGVFNMVFAYGGAMIFVEIAGEMKRPRDFIKGMALAQVVIFVCYLVYGCVIYGLQGQYTLPLAYQGVSKYSWQTVSNVIALITGSIAAGLYGNIGLKVFYVNIVEELFKGPPLMSRGGRLLWSLLVVAFWALAFVIGTAIPGVGSLSGLVAAVCIFQFTYTFPPLLMLGLDLSIDAALADEPFTTPGVAPKQIDTWRQASRWKRAIFAGGRKRLIIKILNFWFFIGALATAGLGMWASGTAVRQTLSAGAATSFGCTAPV